MSVTPRISVTTRGSSQGGVDSDLGTVADWLDALALRFRDDWGRTAQQAESHAATLRAYASADQVLAEIRSAGTPQNELATKLGVSPTYLSDVLNGRRDISDGLAKRMGFERVVLFRRPPA